MHEKDEFSACMFEGLNRRSASLPMDARTAKSRHRCEASNKRGYSAEAIAELRNHSERHRFEAEIETWKTDEPIPAAKAEIIEHCRKCQAMSQVEKAAMVASRPGKIGRIVEGGGDAVS